jgi:hypothetical protein
LETVTCGLATLDYDGDGLLDIYLPSAAPLLGKQMDVPPTNRLYRNLGGFRFQDVTEASGAGDLGFALGVVVGDYDNDGDPDIVVTNFGPTVLLENNGDGTFARREFAEDSAKPRLGAGVAFADYDGDGALDLYVARYVDFSFDRDVSREIFGVPAAPGPTDYKPDEDALYRNDGQGGFQDVSQASGIASVASTGMGVLAFDYQLDHDIDFFVCNDSAANFLFENQGDGTFIETALLAGLAYDFTGARQASMGVDLADINHDGQLDLVATNFSDEIPNLYLNSGLGYFDDIGAAAGLGTANGSVSWGVGLGDLNNDSWDDCFICAGHLIKGISKVSDVNNFEAPHLVYANDAGKFTQKRVVGSALQDIEVSRGCALDDFDNDGRLDVVVLNLDSPAQLIRNATAVKNHFVQLRLVGTSVNRDGSGTRVELLAGDQKLVKELVLGRGYQSHFGSRLHFGLGAADRVEQLKIIWGSNEIQTINDLPIDREVVIVQGQGVANPVD